MVDVFKEGGTMSEIDSMIKCKDCKYWSEGGSCFNYALLPEEEMRQDEDDDCYYCLSTGKNFGCIHGEPKEER